MNITSINTPICNIVGQLPNISPLGEAVAEGFSTIAPPLSRLLNNTLGTNRTSLLFSASMIANGVLKTYQRGHDAYQLNKRGYRNEAVISATVASLWAAFAIYEAIAITKRFC